jgi:catecholate siderophore receptor
MSMMIASNRSQLRAAMRSVLTQRPFVTEDFAPAIVRPIAAGAMALCVALCPLTSLAQEAKPAEATLPTVKVKDADEDVQPTTQIGKLPQTLRDIPQSITVINRQILEAQGATKLTDALRNVPGITISAGEGGQIGDNINLRGFSARTDLFIDGFRDRGQYSRDTFFLEAVEVLKGPSSILFGRGSTGGVINQVSKKPSRRDSAEATLSVGTESYYRATADINESVSDTTAFRVSAMGHYNESTRDVIEAERYGINPSVRFGMGTDIEVGISLLLQRNREIPDYGFPLVQFQGQLSKPIDAPANNYYGFTDDRFDQDVNNVNLSLQFKLTDTATLNNLTQYTGYKTIASPTPLGGAVNPVTGAAVAQPLPAGTPLDSLWSIRQQRDREIEDSSFYNQTNLTLVVPAAITQTFVTGIELGHDAYLNNTFLRSNVPPVTGNLANVQPMPPINLGNPIYQTKPALTSTLVRTQSTRTEANADTLAAYINDQMDFGLHWKLVLGVRWDNFAAEQTQYTYATLAFTDFERTDNMWSPRAGLIWQPTEAQSYYISYGTSFNPSGETLTLAANNADLDPEENRSFEIGAKLSLLDNALQVTTAIYRVEKTNARTTEPGAVQTLDGVIRVDGFEIGATGNITANWQIIAGYSFMNGEIVKAKDIGTGISAGIPAQGKTPQNTPRHSATLWTTYRFLESWEAGGGLVYSTERFVNNFETAIVDGYTRADLTFAFVQPKYSVRLNVLNATDKLYFETASGGRATPATGRTEILSATYRF